VFFDADDSSRNGWLENYDDTWWVDTNGWPWDSCDVLAPKPTEGEKPPITVIPKKQ
jgi:hypothetical protein